MSELTTVARPYAKAAFDFAVEKDAIYVPANPCVIKQSVLNLQQ